MIQKMKLAGLVAGITMAGAVAATAATVSFSALPGAAVPNSAANSTTGDVYQNVFGSVPGKYRSVWDSAGTPYPDFQTNSAAVFTSVSKESSATYKFGAAKYVLEFVWGSPDLYNKIEFLLNGSVVDTLAILVGDDILPATLGVDSASAKISNVAGGNGFDAVRFSSIKENAFEYANVTGAVPLPAGAVLLISGLGAFGIARRRKTA